MAKEIVHLLPGRLRIKVPGLKGNRDFGERIRERLSFMDGITWAKANPLTGKILVYFDELQITHYDIILEIDGMLNNNVGPLDDKTKGAALPMPVRKPEDLSLVWQLFQVISSGTVLLVLFFKHRIFGRSALSYSPRLFQIATITTIVTGYPTFYSGLKDLADQKRINYDLVITATTLSLLVLRESFTGLLVTWLVNLAGLIQSLNLIRSNQAIERLLSITPRDSWILVNGSEISVPTQQLKPGDIAVVYAGETVPVDGQIVLGQAAIDESRITGAPYPVYKNVGSDVLAGSVVQEGTIRVRAELTGSDRYLYRLIKSVNKQLEIRRDYPVPVRRETHKLVKWTLLSAGLTYVLTRNFNRSLAMLLAACPSAAGLAVPTAVGAAIGAAADKGIYVRDGQDILDAGRVNTVVFDKTGTLTTPDGDIEEVIVISREYTEAHIIGLAVLAEGLSGHPVARAIRDKASQMHIGPLAAARELQTLPSMGVKALVNDQTVLVGSKELMDREKVSVHRVKSKLTRFRHLGLSPVFVAVDGILVGLLGIKQNLKLESQQALEQLRAAGIIKVALFTGDISDSAEITAEHLGIKESYGNLTPDQKAALVKSFKDAGYSVAVVGDGINDALAMAYADAGIALGCRGIDSAACAAGILIPSTDPRMVVNAIRIGQETREVITQNYNLGIGLNVIGLALGAAGWVTPLSAGLFANIGTIAVLLNSMGLLKKGTPGRKTGSRSKGSPPPGGSGKKANYEPNEFQFITNWHVMDREGVLGYLETSSQRGLCRDIRLARIQRYGSNQLAAGTKVSWLALFFEPFKDFMVKLLLGASAVSLVVGEYADALTIVAIVGVEAVLGVIQGLKAERSLSALQKLTAPEARTLVEGAVMTLKSAELVPGDIIFLEAGDAVPADSRLIEAVGLEVDEASLTGESLPVTKTDETLEDLQIPLAERSNMLFMGTSVTKGRGMAVVVATGMATEMGRLAKMLQEAADEQTPLQRQLEQLGKQLTVGCLLVCGGVVGAGFLRGRPLMEMLRTGVSLAVGAIPEGLPAVVTITLAFGVQRLVKGHAVVRNLPAVETLGSATVICTDKTGTLTKSEMTVTEVYCDGLTWQVTGEGYLPEGDFILQGRRVDAAGDKNLCRILTAAALCNNAEINYVSGKEPEVAGDPTEIAMLAAAIKGGVPWPGIKEAYCRDREISFDSTRKMMSVVCTDNDGKITMYTKGAPDHVISRCTRVYKDHKIIPLDLKTRNEILSANEGMAAKALRVLAVAYKPVQDENALDEDLEQGLIFIGLLGMVDPPRAGVREAITKCHLAGIKVVMVTGDHPLTAGAIARELGILKKGVVLSGPEIDAMSEEELVSIIDRVEVCSRTTPEHKLRIVKAFKRRDHVVAMTGDGVNDAPAVKEADIGIAMGKKGTDVTREAAAITLTDDNFATIVTAVEEGRTVGDNITKAMRYVLAGNFGEVLAIFLAAVSGMPLPLIPSQILWVNLVTESVPAMAMGADLPEPRIMNRRPRRMDEGILGGGLKNKILTHGVLTGLTTFGIFAGTLFIGGSIVKARTMAFATLVSNQLFNYFDCRKPGNNGAALEKTAENKLLIPSAAVSSSLLLASVYLPVMRPLFQTVPLGAGDWLTILFISGVIGRIDNMLTPVNPCPIVHGR